MEKDRSPSERPHVRPLSERKRAELQLAEDLSQLKPSSFLDLLCDREGIEIAKETRASLGLESKDR